MSRKTRLMLEKLMDRNLVRSFKDGTKLKMSSEITPPLKKMKGSLFTPVILKLLHLTIGLPINQMITQAQYID